MAAAQKGQSQQVGVIVFNELTPLTSEFIIWTKSRFTAEYNDPTFKEFPDHLQLWATGYRGPSSSEN